MVEQIRMTLGTACCEPYINPCGCDPFPQYLCHYGGRVCIAECCQCGATWTEIDEWESQFTDDDAPPTPANRGEE